MTHTIAIRGFSFWHGGLTERVIIVEAPSAEEAVKMAADLAYSLGFDALRTPPRKVEIDTTAEPMEAA